jgi:hypothetical protein
METDTVSETLFFLVFGIPDDGQKHRWEDNIKKYLKEIKPTAWSIFIRA